MDNIAATIRVDINMDLHDNFKFVMAAQLAQQSELLDPSANGKHEIAIRSDLPSPSAAMDAMPPGSEMGRESGSLDLSDSPEEDGRQRRTVTSLPDRDRSPRRSSGSASGSRRPPSDASRTSSVRRTGASGISPARLATEPAHSSQRDSVAGPHADRTLKGRDRRERALRHGLR